MPTYSGNIYQIGEQIPGYVPSVTTPHIWYDQSKTYNNGTNIFTDLSISESLILGDDMDDLWSNEEILNEILQYLNLHIVMIGYDYYVFDWATARNGGTVVWKDILSDDTYTAAYSDLHLTKNNYAGDDTQISIDDVYNQIKVTDSIEKIEKISEDPIKDQAYPIMGKQKYMVEYGATGQGLNSYKTFVRLITDDPSLSDWHYNKGDQAYTREWWFAVDKNPYWSFKLSGVDNYSVIPTDADGTYNNQWKFAEKLFDVPFYSGLISFGHGEIKDNLNLQNDENISAKDHYMCISINGNGIDELSHTQQGSSDRVAPSTDIQFPNESNLENCGISIKSIKSYDANFTPADSHITNYILFSGDIIMTLNQQTTGTRGFDVVGDTDLYNHHTRKVNEDGGKYWDWAIAKRRNNNFATAKAAVIYPSTDPYMFKGRTSPSDKNEDGQHYAQQFFGYAKPGDTPVEQNAEIFVSPPIENGDMSKRFKYNLGTYSYFGATDIIKYVDVLCCQLRIGNKYCVEGHSNGYKTFTWMTTEQLKAAKMYHVSNGETIYDAYINIAINIDDGQFLIGETHKIYNNVTSDMGYGEMEEKEGMAIPIKSTDNVAGDIEFTIIGPVNTSWDNGFRRHRTWFRSEKKTANAVSVLPHVGQIWLKSFKFEFLSDNGKKAAFDDKDVVYASDEQDKFVNINDDTEFRFTTALTADEAEAMGVPATTNLSDVLESSTGNAILYINNNVVPAADGQAKPEQYYVDAYYNEYCDPKMVVETSVHVGDSDIYDTLPIRYFGTYGIGYLNKNFTLRHQEYDVLNGVSKIYLRET